MSAKAPQSDRWVGALPDRYRAGRLSHVATAWTSNVDKHSVDGELSVRLCNYTDVYKNAAIGADLEFMSATATPEQVERFRLRRGDTVITKDSETPDDIGIPSYVEYEADDLVCGYHLAIVRPQPDRVDPRFLFWVMGSRPVLGQWSVLAAGVTRVGIRSTDLTKVSIPLPPLDEQRAIADFLDEQTSRIDTLIDKQNQLVTALRERRAAVTDHLVWSGLDTTLPTSSTGIDTAPDAPMHWARTRAKVLFFERDATSTDGSEELLTVSHLTGITPRSQKNVTMIEAESHEGYRLVEAGDLVINTMWAWMGALGVSPYAGMVSPAYGVYGFRDPSGVDPGYFDGLVRSRQYVTEMTRHSRGIWSSRLRLYPDAFLRLPIVVPPLAEQRAIAAELTAQTTRIDKIIEKVENHIGLAKERRAALITAAVTGEIDVRTAARARQGAA